MVYLDSYWRFRFIEAKKIRRSNSNSRFIPEKANPEKNPCFFPDLSSYRER